MADKKISQLTELLDAAYEDLIAIVDDPSGSASTKKITVSTLFSTVPRFEPVEVTGTSDTLENNKAFLANNASLVTLTLPTAASIGDMIVVVGKGTGGWKVAQNIDQTTYFGNTATTTGTSGSITSSHERDTIIMMCVTANNDWQVIASIGEGITVI